MTSPERLPATDQRIVSLRPSKQAVDVWRPYNFVAEPEVQAGGSLDQVAVLFLTNKECPFRCLMCDLWKHTTDTTVPQGAIPAQIDFALQRLPNCKHIKLYNSGNFFDPLAIPEDDYPAIADRVAAFETVIVENHPKLCGTRVTRFKQLLSQRNPRCQLEVAMGLETVHPEALAILNKRMNLNDFAEACRFLRDQQITLRSFVLLRPPTLSEAAGVEWAIRSLEFAFACGVATVSIIPTRSGNGIMERLQAAGQFAVPKIESLQQVFEAGLQMGQGRVFVDLWDLAKSEPLSSDHAIIVNRLQWMNHHQRLPTGIDQLALRSH